MGHERQAATERVAGHGGAAMQGMADLEGHIAETRRLCGSLTHMLQKDAHVFSASSLLSLQVLAGP